MVVDGGRQTPSTDPVAGQVNQLAQPVLRTGEDTETWWLHLATQRRSIQAVPALGERPDQDGSDDEPGEADESQGDPAEGKKTSDL